MRPPSTLFVQLLLLLSTAAHASGAPVPVVDPSVERAIQQDAASQARADLRARLERHPYFSRVPWELVTDGGRLAFVVQAPRLPDPEYAGRIARRVQLALQDTVAQFEVQRARPFGLERAEDHALTPVVLLPTKGAVADYERRAELDNCAGSPYRYDRALAAPVLYVEEGAARGSSDTLRQHATGPLVLGLLQAYRGERTDPVRWYAQGLAVHLARQTRTETGTLRAQPLEEVHRARLRTTLEGNRGGLLLHALGDLDAIQSWGSLWRIVAQRAQRAGLPQPQGFEVWGSYGRQCLALVTFLETEDHREGFRSYTAGVLQGRTSVGHLAEALGMTGVEELDQAFRGWLGEQLGQAVPRLGSAAVSAAASTAVSTAGEARPIVAGSGGSAQAPESERAAEAVPAGANDVGATALDPRSLGAFGLDAELDLAAATALAARGRYDEARALLLERAAAPASEEESGALDEDAFALEETLGWFEDWIRLRDAFLAARIADGESIRFERDGERVRARLLEREAGVLTLKIGSREEQLPLSELDGAPLALAIPSKEARTLLDGGGWIRGIPLALAGHERAARTLRAGEGASRDLLTATEETLPARRARGARALLLQDLSALELPLSEADALHALERLADVGPQLADDPVLAGRVEAARSLATAAARVELAAGGLGLLMNGEVDSQPPLTPDGPERVRARWSLRDGTQAADLAYTEVLEWRLSKGAQPSLPREQWGQGLQRKGFAVRGRGQYALPIPLLPPVEIRLRYRSELDTSNSSSYSMAGLGFLHPDGKDFILAYDAFYMEVAQGGRIAQYEVPSPPQKFFNSDYELRVEYDGKTVRHYLDEALLDEQPLLDFPRAGGLAPFLVASTDSRVVFTSVEVTGVLGEVAGSAAARDWVERRVAALFGE